MSTAVTTQAARLFVLSLDLPGRASEPIGVMLEDPSADRLFVRLRRDWEALAPEETEILQCLAADLEHKASEQGAARLLSELGNTLSNALRISEPRETIAYFGAADFGRALDRAYREHVRSEVRPFVTHLPRYSLAVAAGRFLENQEVAEEGWEEAPESLRLDGRMFAARIQGTSMEPRIPDGSLCVFRAGVAGSRQGRLVLVEQTGGGANDRYTVKRYTSLKAASGGPGGDDVEWTHERIRLEPLNPLPGSGHEAWDLDPEQDRYRVIAEFVQVLD